MRVGVWSSEWGQSPAQGKHWEGESTVPGNERVPLHTEVFGVWGDAKFNYCSEDLL